MNQNFRGRVFRYLIDQAAFVDTIRLSAFTNQRPELDQLADVKSIGIRSEKSTYSRKVSGIWNVTGNPVSIAYGRVNRFPRVPDASLTVRSESRPVTGAELNKLVGTIFPEATRVRPSLVELTFDVSTLSYPKMFQSAVYRAIRTSTFKSARGERTLNIGSLRSPWSATIYEKIKDEGILRIEFKLRRGFLSARGMNTPNDLLALRGLQISNLMSFRKFSRAGAAAETEGWPETAVDWCQRSSTRPLWLVNRILLNNGADASRVLPMSSKQRQLERMQTQLVW
jgi:hypothetical protein